MPAVKIGDLNQEETCQLIERPIENFPLRYEPDASRRVLELTRGHPYLVQLLCHEIVVLKNEQPPAMRWLASLSDVEAAIPKALKTGSFFFMDIEQNRVYGSALAMVPFMAAQGEGAVIDQKTLARQFPNDLDYALQLVLRRDLIEQTEGGIASKWR